VSSFEFGEHKKREPYISSPIPPSSQADD